VRAELEARDLWSAQGKWVRVCLIIFFLRGGFPTTDESAGSMTQRDNSHSGRYLGSMQSPDCRRHPPLSGEARYPAGARPSKCISINVLVLLMSFRRTLEQLRLFRGECLDQRTGCPIQALGIKNPGKCLTRASCHSSRTWQSILFFHEPGCRNRSAARRIHPQFLVPIARTST
jgi:hypothetical protein